ncbi:hypothetical protein AAIB48_19390 [Paraclostridium benzoelyticum]|uniref:hypothetical protein n=1 Tax=Paraclostridium benzoelyticum TaxID=1629550 RepID=UPI0031CD9968
MKKLVISTLVVLMILTTGCSSTKPLDVENYLKKNNSEINLQDINEFEGLDLIKNDFKNKKIIFTGEYHAFQKDDLFRMKLIKYLQEEIGLNYYLVEMGYSSAYFFNKYLESGDEEILKKVFSNLKGTQAFNKDDYNFFKDLYEFNKTLIEEDKIKIVGIDIEHNMGSSYDYIKDIIKDETLKRDALEKTLESLKNIQSYIKTLTPANKDEDYKMKLLNDLNLNIDILLEDIKNNKELYINLFKEDFFGFEIVVKNIKTKCLSEFTDDAEEYMSKREGQMYANFTVQDDKIDDAIYFGQFGAFHIDKSPVKVANVQSETKTTYVDFESIAYRINNSNKYKGKVMSILYSYENKYDEDISSINKEMFNNYLNSEDDCILFDLKNSNSPFKEEYISPLNEKAIYDNKKHITDYIDCIVILKNVSHSPKLYF